MHLVCSIHPWAWDDGEAPQDLCSFLEDWLPRLGFNGLIAMLRALEIVREAEEEQDDEDCLVFFLFFFGPRLKRMMIPKTTVPSSFEGLKPPTSRRMSMGGASNWMIFRKICLRSQGIGNTTLEPISWPGWSCIL